MTIYFYMFCMLVKHWFVAMYIAKSLSQYKRDGYSKGTLKNLEEDILAIKFHM